MSDLGPLDEHFVRLIDGPSGPGVALLALLIAAGVGAVHGLAPGHGKAMGAAYLVGTRGRVRDAVWLGLVVAAMHTATVLALALGLHLVLRNSGPNLPTLAEEASPLLRLLAAGIVFAVGVWLAVRAAGNLRHGHDHDHDHAVAPLSRRGLVALGVSGGLLPSPSAFLVLATAAFTGRTAFGLLLVAAFSLGLATTVTVVGIAAVRGRELVARRGSTRTIAFLVRWGPLTAAIVVVGAAVALATEAMRAL